MIKFILENIFFIILGFFWFSWFLYLFNKAAKNNAFTTLLCSLFVNAIAIAMFCNAPIVENWVKGNHLLTYASSSAPIADSARVIVTQHRLSAVNKEAIGNEQ